MDFNKLINDLQDVETKVMARKMLLEGGSGSSVNTPTTGGSSRRADSVASDASMFLHMGQDLYREHFDNRSPSMQALDAAAAAAGVCREAALHLCKDCDSPNMHAGGSCTTECLGGNVTLCRCACSCWQRSEDILFRVLQGPPVLPPARQCVMQHSWAGSAACRSSCRSSRAAP